MNAQEAKAYLQQELPDMVVEVIENYSNQYTTGATRFIFTKGEQKANLMFKKGIQLDTQGLSGIVSAIIKKFDQAPKDHIVAEPIALPKVEAVESKPQPSVVVNNDQAIDILKIIATSDSFGVARFKATEYLNKLKNGPPMT